MKNLGKTNRSSKIENSNENEIEVTIKSKEMALHFYPTQWAFI